MCFPVLNFSSIPFLNIHDDTEVVIVYIVYCLTQFIHLFCIMRMQGRTLDAAVVGKVFVYTADRSDLDLVNLYAPLH